MEVLYSSVSSEAFMFNIQTLMEQLRSPQPLDTIVLSCRTCCANFPLYLNGILRLKTGLEKNLATYIEEKIQILIDNHKTKKCPSSNISFHQVIGLPDSIFVSFPETDANYIGDLELNNSRYKVEMMIKNETENKAIFVLYQKNGASGNHYQELINSNFHTFLNVLEEVDEVMNDKTLVCDDDNESEQSSKRMTGGGRKINAPYNYECLWCNKDDIEKGLKGRYLEIKNYRDHFRKCHMSEQGGGIPMSEFLSKVNRREPTWFCRKCRRQCSLPNMMRHKAMCHRNNDDGSSSKTVEEDLSTASADSRYEDDQTRHSSSDEDVSERRINYKRCLPPSKLDSSTDDDNVLDRSIATNKDKEESVETALLDESISLVKTVGDEPSDTNSKNNKKFKVNQPKSAAFFEPFDEIDLTFSNEMFPAQSVIVKIETEVDPSQYNFELEEDTNQAGPSNQKQNSSEFNKWWLKLPKDKYFAVDPMGPEIFCKEDPEDFVKAAREKWLFHKAEKERLDTEMIEAESEEAETRQFSLIRDKSFVTEYTSFVSSFSAKDVLHIFTEEYEIMDLPKGAKSSTAGQYGYRIIEFFKFMAAKYEGFHLDWMVDYRGSIEKTYPDGHKTKDFFLPTMDDLREFIKSFKYGSNPAANCGLRIFALKKMMEFLTKEVKEHEYLFEGSITEKNKTVECLVKNLKNMNDGVCPDGTIKHISTASNKCHKKLLLEQMAKRPGRSIDSIMKGVGDYVQSDEYNIQRTNLIELACRKNKVPTQQEYTNSTNWLLEQLICLGGNRPCALLGITVKDWEEKQPGYCPFDQDEENEMFQDDPTNDARKVLKDPFIKPKGEEAKKPTGFIVNSETDKISVNTNQPCYIWFPNEIVDLVNNHSLMAQKILPRSVDLYHPNTRLFLNINGNPISRIECKHFKNYIGLPITAYDFRRSLSTFCLDSKLDLVKNSESAVLRHRQETGYAYYYQKHGQKVEYVSIQYALKHGLVKASVQAVDEYCISLRKDAMNEEWELAQKRSDKALEYHQSILQQRKKGLQNARQKGNRYWILPNEYDAFISGIEEAIRMEELRQEQGTAPGPFFNLLNYKPDKEGAGTFPPTHVWQVDMYRVLYGLVGEIGEEMRKAELSVYNGVPFSKGYTGRKKITEQLENLANQKGPKKQAADWVVAEYWRNKIRREALQITTRKWNDLRFIFTPADLDYYRRTKEIKTEVEL
jgi:hypothetical protein